MIIYSNLHKKDYYEKARDYLADEFIHGERNEITYDDIEDFVQSEMDDDWYNLIGKCLATSIETNKYVALGFIGRWDGTYFGWSVLKSIVDFSKLLNDCDYVTVEDRDGRLFVTGIHHDGTNQYELMKFANDGYDYYLEHDELSNKEMIDTLINEGYVVKPNITWEY